MKFLDYIEVIFGENHLLLFVNLSIVFFYENAILFSSIDISRSYSKNKNLIIKLKKIPFPTQKNHYCIDYYLTYIC